jgi:hypothetical protein
MHEMNSAENSHGAGLEPEAQIFLPCCKIPLASRPPDKNPGAERFFAWGGVNSVQTKGRTTGPAFSHTALRTQRQICDQYNHRIAPQQSPLRGTRGFFPQNPNAA